MTLFKKFERNTEGRDLIVGDVHGHFSKLEQALERVVFDSKKDRLFSVGDMVDRGPESDLVTSWLAQPWFHAVRGNHEEMAIDHAICPSNVGWYVANGGAWNVTNPPSLQQEIREEFQALPLAIELETSKGVVAIIHADCPRKTWSEFREAMAKESEWERQHLANLAIWSRKRIDSGDRSGVPDVRAMVCGHTPVSGGPTVLGNVFFIDTGGWLGREFTILDAETLEAA